MKNNKGILRDALRILRRSEVSELRLIQLLEKKGYKEDEITQTIEFLKKKNFLNNTRLATLTIEKCIRNKKGPNFIIYTLLKKGIPEGTISELLARMYPEELEYKIAKELLELKKIPFRKIEIFLQKVSGRRLLKG